MGNLPRLLSKYASPKHLNLMKNDLLVAAKSKRLENKMSQIVEEHEDMDMEAEEVTL